MSKSTKRFDSLVVNEEEKNIFTHSKKERGFEREKKTSNFINKEKVNERFNLCIVEDNDSYGRDDDSYGRDNGGYGRDNDSYGRDNERGYGRDDDSYGRDNGGYGRDNDNIFKKKKPDLKKVYRGRGDYNSFSRKMVSEKNEKPKNFEMKEEEFPSL